MGNPSPKPINVVFNTPPGTYASGAVGATNLDVTVFSPAATGMTVHVQHTSTTLTTYPAPLVLPQTVAIFPIVPCTVTVKVWTYKNGRRSAAYNTYTWTLT